MQRTCLIVSIAAIVIFSARLAGQSPSDFSGTWTLASSGTYPPEQRMTITQDATTLSIDSTAYQVRGRTDGIRSTFSETPYPMRVTYVLDGVERPSRVIADRPAVALQTTSAAAMTSTTEESVSKAVWAGRQLVIMTYEKERVTAPSRTPAVVVIRRTIRQTLAIAADGTLVWETLIVPDPLPWGREATPPAPFRKVYKRG